MRTIVIAIVCAAASAHAQTAPPNSKTLTTVYFASGESEVSAAQREEMRAAAEWLARNPDRLLIVEGHADRTGGARDNLLLSQRRAESVRAAIVRAGGDPLRIVASAHGEALPRGEPELSRRVEIRGTVHTFAELIEEQHAPDES